MDNFFAEEKTDRNKAVIEMLADNYTQAEVGREFGISAARVGQILARHRFREKIKRDANRKINRIKLALARGDYDESNRENKPE